MGSTQVEDRDWAFNLALQALSRSDDWKIWAISGRMSAELEAAFAVEERARLGHHMHRGYVGPAEDRRAWLWGYHWKEGGPPPPERPWGACAECWRLGDACQVHYRGLCRSEVEMLVLQKADPVVISSVLHVKVSEAYVPTESLSFEHLQFLALGPDQKACAEECEFPGCFVSGCVKKGG